MSPQLLPSDLASEMPSELLPSDSSSPWSSLPSDLLERALALLPLPDVFRMRAVCKRWNCLIHCAQFQEMSPASPSSSSSSWGPFFSPRVGWVGRGSPVVPWSAYDLVRRRRTTLPELRFPTTLESERGGAGRRSCGWNLMAADGGLLCFGASDGRGVLVCNPMSNRWKEIAAVGGGARTPVICQMVVDEETRSYKILFAGNAVYKQPDVRFSTNLVDVYDSSSQTWSSAATLSADLLLRSGACCGSSFYLLTRHPRTGVHAVVSLSLPSLAWRGDRVLSIPEGLSYPYLVACRGRIYLVGGSSEATDRTPMASISVYELQEQQQQANSEEDGDAEWALVSEYVDGPFLRSTGAIYGCGASGCRIYVVTYAYDMWVAVFNCDARVWEEPIKGNFFDMKDIFETKFRVLPNLGVAP